ncbi:MAG: glycosyltransferase family 2 protein [Rhizobiales bacterium]|nr:glycosyltransferase family 2 protein [Hyphomicrobiales bacterium]
MSTNPGVSIIVNCYNYERFVGAAIDSALAQDHRPLQVIVVDDGSTDRSWALIEGYGARIEARRQDNQGQGAACLHGLAHARHEIVIFLDADDILELQAARMVAGAWRSGVAKVHVLPRGDRRERLSRRQCLSQVRRRPQPRDRARRDLPDGLLSGLADQRQRLCARLRKGGAAAGGAPSKLRRRAERPRPPLRRRDLARSGARALPHPRREQLRAAGTFGRALQRLSAERRDQARLPARALPQQGADDRPGRPGQ